MPILLALSHVHQLLIREGLRMETSLIAQSGETREVHHVACLLGYGANAVVPYLAQRTIEQLTRQGQLSGTSLKMLLRIPMYCQKALLK